MLSRFGEKIILKLNTDDFVNWLCLIAQFYAVLLIVEYNSIFMFWGIVYGTVYAT